jgi:hypothetical protein
MNNGTGPEQIDKFLLYPDKMQLSDMEHFNMKGELLISHHTREKLSYLATFSWATTQTPGTVLWSHDVGPMILATGVEPPKSFAVNEMDYFCIGYENWRGGLSYVIEVCTSNFHEGRLEITYHPNTAPAPTDINAALSQYAASMYVRSADNTIAVHCPFLSDKPWRRIWAGEPIAQTPGETQYRYQDFFSGTIAIRVGAALRAPTTVVPKVDVNVYVYGAPDFQVANPSARNRSVTILPANFRNQVTPHSGRMVPFNVNMGPVGQKSITLAPRIGFTYDPKVPHYGETIDNIQELCKRYSKAQPIGWKQDKSKNNVAQVALVDILFSAETANVFQNRFIHVFRNFRGPLCFKFHAKATRFNEASVPPRYPIYVTFCPTEEPVPIDQIGGLFGYPTEGVPRTLQTPFPMTYFDETSHAEIMIPFYTNSATALLFNQCDAMVGVGNGYDYLQGKFLFFSDSDGVPFTGAIDISFAFGDETQIGTFIGLPVMKYATDTIDGKVHSLWPDLWIHTATQRDPWDESEDWTLESQPFTTTARAIHRRPSDMPVRGPTKRP